MSHWSKLPRSARGYHGMTAGSIIGVISLGFVIGAAPVLLIGLPVLYLLALSKRAQMAA